MPIRIRTFGKLAELTGSPQIEVANVTDTDALKTALAEQFPELAGLNFFIAINNRMVTGNTPIPRDAVLALLPPFSGG